MRNFRIFLAAITVCLTLPFLPTRADDSSADNQLFIYHNRKDVDNYVMAAQIMAKQGLLDQHVVDKYKRDRLFAVSGLLDQDMVEQKMAEQISGGMTRALSAGLKLMSPEEGTYLAIAKSLEEADRHVEGYLKHPLMITPAPEPTAVPGMTETGQQPERPFEYRITRSPEYVMGKGLSEEEAREYLAWIDSFRELQRENR